MTWPVVTLNDLQSEEPRAITDGPFGSNLARRHYTETGPRVVRLQNIGDGRFVDEKAHISEEHFESLRAHEVKAGDLLVASLGEVLPRACLAPVSLGPAIVKADCIRIRLREDVDSRWVLHAMQRPEVRRWADEHRHGVGRPRLGLGVIRQIPVPLPPLDEQLRIVDLLEDHLSRLDAAENYLASGLRRAEVWHQRLLAYTLWPAHYPRARIGDLLREPMRNGRSDRAATGGEAGTRSLTLTAVTKNAFTEANTKVTVTTPDRARDLWLEPGDVFVQRSNTPALVGTTAQYDGPREWAIFPDLLIRLRADEDKIDSRFLAAALQSKPGHDQLRRKTKGLAGSMPKIDQAAIADTTIPLPPVDVQQRLLAIVEDAGGVLALLRAELASAQRRSRVLRRALLEAAFAGRLTGNASDLSAAEEMIGA